MWKVEIVRASWGPSPTPSRFFDYYSNEQSSGQGPKPHVGEDLAAPETDPLACNLSNALADVKGITLKQQRGVS